MAYHGKRRNKGARGLILGWTKLGNAMLNSLVFLPANLLTRRRAHWMARGAGLRKKLLGFRGGGRNARATLESGWCGVVGTSGCALAP